MKPLTSFADFLKNAGTVPEGVVDDIRDIRPAIPLPESVAWEPWALGALALLAVAGAATWWWRRSRRVRPSEPWDVALARLADTVRLMQPENAYAFSISVSETLRTYLERRFGMPLVNRTTPEFLSSLTSDASGDLAPWRDELRHFLGLCDLAKFARWQLTEDEMLGLYVAAKKVVEATRPQPYPSRMARPVPEGSTR